MKFIIFLRNGIYGAILLLIPLALMPHMGRIINDLFDASWPLPVILAMMVILCIYVLIDLIPGMRGYSGNGWKYFQIAVVEILSIILFISAVCILYELGFYDSV